MTRIPSPPLAATLTALTALLACAGRPSLRADASTASDASVATDAPVDTAIGRACVGDEGCAGLRCYTTVTRMCNGPIRPHEWRAEFPGGWCNPAIDLATGNIAAGCPAGTQTYTIFVGCDGIPFRYCGRNCARDQDCRVAEGYRCHPELNLCVPPVFAPEVSDGGTPDV